MKSVKRVLSMFSTAVERSVRRGGAAVAFVSVLVIDLGIARAAESDPDMTMKIGCGDHIERANAGVSAWHGSTGVLLGPYTSKAAALVALGGGLACLNKDGGACGTHVCPQAEAGAVTQCEKELEDIFADDTLYICDPEQSSDPACRQPPFRGCEKKRFGGNCAPDPSYRYLQGNLSYSGTPIQSGSQWFIQCLCTCIAHASGTLKLGCTKCKAS
jgi:hypothetical protein